MSTPNLILEPGSCPKCGTDLTPYLYDVWNDETQALDGGVAFHCQSCLGPKHVTAWSEHIRRKRIDLRINLIEAGRAIGGTSADFSAIECGYQEPTAEQRRAINALLELDIVNGEAG